MEIDVRELVTGELCDAAWKFYVGQFKHLNELTVQRHLMTWHEFVDVCVDPRIQKWLVVDESGVVVAMATYTNKLDAMPLISPAYFKRRWPKLFGLERIWYCGFVAVAPAAPAQTFVDMIGKMYRVAEAVEGVIGLDICRHNDEAYRLGKAVTLSLKRVSGNRVHAERADEQVFYLFETSPAAASASPLHAVVSAAGGAE